MLKKPFSKYLNLLKRSKLSCIICSVFSFEITKIIQKGKTPSNHFSAFEIFLLIFTVIFMVKVALAICGCPGKSRTEAKQHLNCS